MYGIGFSFQSLFWWRWRLWWGRRDALLPNETQIIFCDFDLRSYFAHYAAREISSRYILSGRHPFGSSMKNYVGKCLCLGAQTPLEALCCPRDLNIPTGIASPFGTPNRSLIHHSGTEPSRENPNYMFSF